jgi:hypothetical protein
VNGSLNQEYNTPLLTDGFTFTSGHFHIIDNAPQCVFDGCAPINGTQYLASDGPLLGQAVVMTRTDGGTFRVDSLQASRLFANDTDAEALGFMNASTLLLVGALSGGGTVSVQVALPAMPAFNSFTLPAEFTELTSLTISGLVPGITDSASWGVDSIEVELVPEPRTVFMLLTGCCAALLRLRKNHQ